MLRILGLFLALLPSPAQAAPIVTPELPDLVEKTLPGVANISSVTISTQTVYGMDEFMRLWGIPKERRNTSLGTGFVIDNDGFILTNHHVVAHADEVVVTLLDKRQFKARIIGKDEKMDLALLQIRDDKRRVPTKLTPLAIGNSDQVRIAEPVFAVGNPFGFQHTVTVGIISAKNRTIGQGPFDNFLQTDAAINPGNSGGPLFNFKGEVIGVNTAIISRTGQSGGLGFAIPVNEAKQILADLKRYGRVPRPWLGVLAERLNPAIARFNGIQADEGVLVYNLVERGPADRAGLEIGDVIVSVDGAKTLEPNEVERALSKHRPGEKAKVAVKRGRKTIEINVDLSELPKLESVPQGII